jgi:pyruvate,orthophosphate dikinase
LNPTRSQNSTKKGVGQLVKIACDLGRKTRTEIKLGICGEHGGDPSTVEFLPQHRF